MTRLYFGVSSVDDSALGYVLDAGAPLLVSFAIDVAAPRVWASTKRGPVMLDSGAFTAFNTGKVIDQEALLRESMSGKYAEAAALDAIGDPDTSRKNWEWQLERGGDTWPTFHVDEPWALLKEYCAKSWKVALGGMVGLEKRHRRDEWLNQVFSRAWPHRFHAFGVFNERILSRFPFHSADSAIWALQVFKYGACAMPGKTGPAYRSVPNRKNAIDLDVKRRSARFQVERWLRMQTTLKSRWRLALAEADRKAPPRPVIKAYA